MAKICTAAEAAELIEDGISIMVGGFLSVGSSEVLIQEIVEPI